MRTSISETPVTLGKVSVCEGPNVWSKRPVVCAVVEAPGVSPDELAALRHRLSPEPASESDGTGMWKNVGTIVESLAPEMQVEAGEDVSFSASRETESAGIFDVAIEFDEPEMAIAAIEIVVALLNSILNSSTGTFDLRTAFDTRLGRIAQQKIGRYDDAAMVRAARARGIPVRHVGADRRLIEFGLGARLKRFKGMTVSGTSHLGAGISSNKWLTNQLLRELGLPVPECIPVRSADGAVAAAKRIGFPVVVKPINGSQGRGIGTDLRTPEEVREAFAVAAGPSRRRRVIVERCVTGDEFRVLVIGDRVAAVAERVPASVTGDGVHTVEELVTITNAHPWRGPGLDSLLAAIRIEGTTAAALERQSLTLQSVPAAGQHVVLKLVSNVSQGAVPVDRTQLLHPETARLARTAARAIGIDICGLDLITTDLTRSLWETGGVFLEVNFEPGGRIHLPPHRETTPDIASDILDMLFPAGTPVRPPIVVVAGGEGAARVAELIASVAQQAGHAVGLTTITVNRIGDNEMRSNGLLGRTNHQLVLRNPDVEFAVLQVESRDMQPPGPGFDVCDVVVLIKPLVLERAALRSGEEVLLDVVGEGGYAVIDAEHPSFDALCSLLPERSIVFGLDPAGGRLRSWVDRGGRALTVRDGEVVLLGNGLEQIVAFNGGTGCLSTEVRLPVLAAAMILHP